MWYPLKTNMNKQELQQQVQAFAVLLSHVASPTLKHSWMNVIGEFGTMPSSSPSLSMLSHARSACTGETSQSSVQLQLCCFHKDTTHSLRTLDTACSLPEVVPPALETNTGANCLLKVQHTHTAHDYLGRSLRSCLLQARFETSVSHLLRGTATGPKKQNIGQAYTSFITLFGQLLQIKMEP